MQALASLGDQLPDYRYVCKVWAQPRTDKRMRWTWSSRPSSAFRTRCSLRGPCISTIHAFFASACDVYAAPSRLEGFGMGQVEAGACGKPVIGIRAMAMLETLVHGQTALLAGIAQENIATGATWDRKPASSRSADRICEPARRRLSRERARSRPTPAQLAQRFPRYARSWVRADASAPSNTTTEKSPSSSSTSCSAAWPGWGMNQPSSALSVNVEAARRAALPCSSTTPSARMRGCRERPALAIPSRTRAI